MLQVTFIFGFNNIEILFIKSVLFALHFLIISNLTYFSLIKM